MDLSCCQGCCYEGHCCISLVRMGLTPHAACRGEEREGVGCTGTPPSMQHLVWARQHTPVLPPMPASKWGNDNHGEWVLKIKGHTARVCDPHALRIKIKLLVIRLPVCWRVSLQQPTSGWPPASSVRVVSVRHLPSSIAACIAGMQQCVIKHGGHLLLVVHACTCM